jgi:hypothetical protein
VLLWNVYFIGQTLILSPRLVEGRHVGEPAGEPAGVANRVLSAAILTAAVGLPFLEPWGRWDVWPSWAVYATAPPQVRFEIRGDAAARLPESLRRFVGSSPDDAGADERAWHAFRIDRWSLDSVAAPIYPQARFQTAVGLAVARRYGLDDGIRAVALGRADRRTGRRRREVVTGQAAIERWASRFILNVDAASPWSR